MQNSDYKYTMRFLHSYGNAVVVQIKNRIRKDNLIDTGALLNSINYEVIVTNNTFEVEFKIGDGNFTPGSKKPSEYGVYLDLGTVNIKPYYFFSAPVPNYTAKMFKEKIAETVAKDTANFLRKQLKEELRNLQ